MFGLEILTSAKRMSQSSSQKPAALIQRLQNLRTTQIAAMNTGMVEEA